jgi:AcrR family transcriptional regulator
MSLQPVAEGRATEGRPTLTRDRVLRAAVEMADVDGIAALSMRRLGRALGVEAMSLYNHVANKEELLDGIVDIALAEVELPRPGEPWKPAMRHRAVSAREMLGRHPWAAGLFESRLTLSATRLGYGEAVIGCLREAGFSVGEAIQAFGLLDSYIYGFAIQERNLPVTGPGAEHAADAFAEALPADAYPHLAETARAYATSGFDFGDQFAVGLELILDGLERMHAEHGGSDS